MSKRDKVYMGIFVVIAVLYIGYEIAGPEPTDWSESYSRNDKIPYGTYILGEELNSLFPGQNIRELIIPPFEYLRNSEGDTTKTRNWIFINDVVDPDKNELSLLMDAVAGGSNLFISTSGPGDALSDTLGFSVSFQTAISSADSLFTQPGNIQSNTTINFENPELREAGGWTYEESRSIYFTRVDTAKTVLLGHLSSDNPNFIRMSHGKGFIFIHLFPKAFTNYYNREYYYATYAFKALSYLPVNDVIWDEYYKAGRSGYSTPMGYVLSQPPLRNAWFLILAGIGLFMIFKGRRIQRAIPEQQLPVNSTLEFARIIGSLYLEKGTHKEIALKKIKFFTDYCRQHLGISIPDAADDPVKAIAERSGVPKADVSEMMDSIRHVRDKPDISKDELKNVTSKIDQFYKNSLR